tara:strand:- start:16 stop:522 length:507 start_codon:yes stop_codon:yes gene_type:complete
MGVIFGKVLMIKIRLVLTFFVLFMTLIGPAFGQDGNALQVTGSQSETIHLNLEELDALAQTEFVTSTIWSSGEIHFSGVSLKALLKHLQFKGNNIEMIALDGYVVSMPIADLEDNAPIISTRLNGEIMPIRRNGPYWVVFPYDSDLKYQTEVNFARSIWQLTHIRVVD